MEYTIQRTKNHTYNIKLQTPLGDKQLSVPINTKGKSEGTIINELIEGINRGLGSYVNATKVNKPIKKLRLKTRK